MTCIIVSAIIKWQYPFRDTIIQREKFMVTLRISEILKEQGKTEYWLFRQAGLSDYSSFKKLIHNETSRIRFDTIARICEALDVPVRELFITVDEAGET